MTLQKQEQGFLALQPPGLEWMKENLAHFKNISPWDMDKATIPTGGGLTWQVPEMGDDDRPVKTLDGIILHWMPYRRRYKQGLDDGGAAGPPDCFSSDGITGVGDPGGDCETCPFNEWGSGKNGSKGCPESRLLFLLQPKAYLPLMVQLPRMSAKPFDQYLMRLASKGIMYSSVVTSFGLQKAQQKGGGLTYSQAVPTLVRYLSDEEVSSVKGLAFRPRIPQARNAALNG